VIVVLLVVVTTVVENSSSSSDSEQAAECCNADANYVIKACDGSLQFTSAGARAALHSAQLNSASAAAACANIAHSAL
jgi:hypothetical protein